MTYTIGISAEVEQVLTARAQARGITVSKYLYDLVIREAAPGGAPTPAVAVAPHDAEMDALEERALELAGNRCASPSPFCGGRRSLNSRD